MTPRYPVYVISKGRADVCLTANLLRDVGLPFHLVIEPQEFDDYASRYADVATIQVLPFSNLGLGGIPARNWVWGHALASGAEKHWILDDNIEDCFRVYASKKIRCDIDATLAVVEDFTERYENIAISGPNYTFLVVHKSPPPFMLNKHVYSALLIRNDIPFRWRGRYNEDTDLCLQVLSAGWCTVLINAFTIKKKQTMTMKGGNTTELYQGDGRLRMARSLERMWPGVVETKRVYGRPQHRIKRQWHGFDTPLIRKPDAVIEDDDSRFGLKLETVKPIRSERLRALVDAHTAAH